MNKLLNCNGSVKLMINDKEIYPLEIQHGLPYEVYISKELTKNSNQKIEVIKTIKFGIH